MFINLLQFIIQHNRTTYTYIALRCGVEGNENKSGTLQLLSTTRRYGKYRGLFPISHYNAGASIRALIRQFVLNVKSRGCIYACAVYYIIIIIILSSVCQRSLSDTVPISYYLYV